MFTHWYDVFFVSCLQPKTSEALPRTLFFPIKWCSFKQWTSFIWLLGWPIFPRRFTQTTYINTNSESLHNPRYSSILNLYIILLIYVSLNSYFYFLIHFNLFSVIHHQSLKSSLYCWMNIFDWYQPNLAVCTHFKNVHRDYTVGWTFLTCVQNYCLYHPTFNPETFYIVYTTVEHLFSERYLLPNQNHSNIFCVFF